MLGVMMGGRRIFHGARDSPDPWRSADLPGTDGRFRTRYSVFERVARGSQLNDSLKLKLLREPGLP